MKCKYAFSTIAGYLLTCFLVLPGGTASAALIAMDWHNAGDQLLTLDQATGL